MKAATIGVKESTGRILCCTIFRPGGRKLLAKGHVLSEEDVRLLETEGLGQVWVTELEEGEVGEDDAVGQAAAEMGCGCLEIRLAAGKTTGLWGSVQFLDGEIENQMCRDVVHSGRAIGIVRNWLDNQTNLRPLAELGTNFIR